MPHLRKQMFASLVKEFTRNRGGTSAPLEKRIDKKIIHFFLYPKTAEISAVSQLYPKSLNEPNMVAHMDDIAYETGSQK